MASSVGASLTPVTLTLVVATLLQTRAPTGKRCGPVAGLLLSRPMTFQLSGVTVREALAGTAVARASVKRTIPAGVRIG